VAGLDARAERVEKKVDQLDDKVDALDRRAAVVEVNTGNINQNVARLEVDVRDLRSSLDTKFIWIASTMIGFGVALLAAMAKGFHWVK
jgi:hypothetical protein